MPNIVVQRVLSGPTSQEPFTSHGKTIEPVMWFVDGVVDGAAFKNIKLRAFSKKVHAVVVAGNTVVCDPPTVHQGQTEYKITTPSQENPVNTRPNSSGAPASRPSGAPSAPKANYTKEEMEDVFLSGYDFAVSLLGKKGDQQAVVSLVATYVIQATREGIKIKSGAPEKQADPPTVSEQIYIALEKGGLQDRVDNCKVTEETLVAWWKEANGNSNMFCARANLEFTKLESGAPDNIPF